mgnify:FL=1
MANSDPLEAVRAELRAVGISFRLQHGKHTKVKFMLAGREMMYVIPSTAGDGRSTANCRAGIRRLLRLNGVKLSTP